MSTTCRYIKWTVQSQRTHATDMQAAEFRLTLAGSPVSWGGGVSITNPSGGASAAPEDEAKLIDGSTANKCFATLAGDIVFLIDNGANITFDGYQYCTGNDEPGRDPDYWTLEGSNYGSSYTNLATVTSATVSDGVLSAATRTAWTGVFTATGTVSDTASNAGAMTLAIPTLAGAGKATQSGSGSLAVPIPTLSGPPGVALFRPYFVTG